MLGEFVLNNYSIPLSRMMIVFIFETNTYLLTR